MQKSEVINKRKGGYIALTTVLIIATVVVATALTVAVTSTASGQSGLAYEQGEDALHEVESCIEDTLMRLHGNTSYSGGTLVLPEGSCIVTVSVAGQTYTITAYNSATNPRRTLQTVITRGSCQVVTSWIEQP